MKAQNFSHYRILEKLGSGGMGEVYLAEDLRLGRKVALKLLSEEFTTNRERLHRFEQEACAASSLNHPNILTIYEVGADDGRHFMATEYIDGQTLRERAGFQQLEISEILDIAIQIASALDEAHAAGIVHRDIKPENIMIRRNGYVKLLDFGLAKLTEKLVDHSSLDGEASTRVFVQTDVGVVMGTSHYMSPEQTRGLAVDARTDLWSLGVVMYEMAAGKPPFGGETSTDVLVSITQKEPQPLARFSTKVPAEFEWIIAKALRKERDERYQTAKELLTDLRRLKQRLEFEAELERSVSPEKLAAMTTVSDHGAVATGAATAQTQTISSPPYRSSAEYIVGEIKKRKKSAALVAALFVAALAVGGFFYFNRAQALTDKDTILIADFTNTTGETVFDGTLRQALGVQLAQTPFLNIFPDERVRQTLRFMGRSPDDRITRDIGREICQRQGIKALLIGSIASLGSHYVITLEALNAQSGDTIARDQIEAENKEQVLASLSKSASRLREKLGESLNSIKKFDVPLEQATTSSLEALQAYATGNDLRSKEMFQESASFYKRATELDPNFAMAFARMAVFHANNFELEKAQYYAQKAYDLRDRVSEHERFYISEKFHTYVNGDMDKVIEVLKAWAKTYPNDFVPHNNLANNYSLIGQYEDALKEAIEAVRLDPRSTTARGNLADIFLRLGRNDEAQQAFEELRKQAPDATSTRFLAFALAFVRNDQQGMQKEIEWAKGRPTEVDLLAMQSATAALAGKMGQVKEQTRLVVDGFKAQGRLENASQAQTELATLQAAVGFCRDAQANAAAGLAISRGRLALANAAAAYCFCGDTNRSQALIDELMKNYPQDTLINVVVAPGLRAQVERNRGNFAEAIRLLEAGRRYDLGNLSSFRTNYLRGLIYLDQKDGTQAASEFRKILDNRSRDLFSPLYPLAHLGLARSAAISGDLSTSRKAYQDFFVAWREADSDVPLLKEAQKEYDLIK
jgi:serine/threonine protein kinase/Tfp pilus assembly protein PilF